MQVHMKHCTNLKIKSRKSTFKNRSRKTTKLWENMANRFIEKSRNKNKLKPKSKKLKKLKTKNHESKLKKRKA